jgi:hypothetical protein
MYGAATGWFFFSSRPSDGVRLWLFGVMIDLRTEADLLRRCPAAGAADCGVAMAELPAGKNYAMGKLKVNCKKKHIKRV